MAPPMPSPVMNRITVIEGIDHAKALATEKMPMKATLMISSGLRPKRSPSGPDSSAPNRMPTLDITNAVVNSGGATPQAFESEGAAMPMVPRSNPSNACTSAQSTRTRIYNAPHGWFSSAASTGDLNSALMAASPYGLDAVSFPGRSTLVHDYKHAPRRSSPSIVATAITAEPVRHDRQQKSPMCLVMPRRLLRAERASLHGPAAPAALRGRSAGSAPGTFPAAARRG